MRVLRNDIRFGIRILARSPGLTSIAIVALALGIGANTAIFSVVNRVLLGNLPFREADRLVMVWGIRGAGKDNISPILPADFADIKSQNHVFEGMAGSSDALYTLTGAGDAESIIGYRFDSDFFSVLGTAPILGRTGSRGGLVTFDSRGTPSSGPSGA